MKKITAEGRLFDRIAGQSDRLMLNEVDGVMWVTNSYWAVSVPHGDHPLAKMVRSFNLPLAPAALAISDTLSPDSFGKVPDIASLVNARPDDLAPIHPHRVGGDSAYVFDGSNFLSLYDLPGGRMAALNTEYRRFVEEMAPGDWYGGPEALKRPLFRIHDDKVTALIMGVRCRASEHVPTELATTGAP